MNKRILKESMTLLKELVKWLSGFLDNLMSLLSILLNLMTLKMLLFFLIIKVKMQLQLSFISLMDLKVKNAEKTIFRIRYWNRIGRQDRILAAATALAEIESKLGGIYDRS